MIKFTKKTGAHQPTWRGEGNTVHYIYHNRSGPSEGYMYGLSRTAPVFPTLAAAKEYAQQMDAVVRVINCG